VYNPCPGWQICLQTFMSDRLNFDDDEEVASLKAAWNHVLERFKNEKEPFAYDRFIRPLKLHSLHGDVAVILAPGTFIQEHVRDRYAAQLEDCLSDELGRTVAIQIRHEPREKSEISAPNQPISLTSRPETNSFQPSPRYSFDNYVVGQSNRLAVAGAKAVASEPGYKYNPLFIYGASGLGKTHLLHAIAKEILNSKPSFPLAFVSAQQFAEDFVNALQGNRIDQFRRLQRGVGMWLVDDIQFIAGKDKTQEEIFHTFNYLHSLGKQIVICSDRPPRELFLMDERLRSRFEAGLVADVQLPDTETRCAILKSKAAQEKLDLDHEVAMYLAESVPGNIRVLEGALTRLAVGAGVENRPICMELAVSMVELYYRSGILAKPSFDQIVGAVSKHYKIASDEIKGTSRKAPIVHARHIAIFLTREITGDSWKHIGGLFGDRDHTSMMHGYQKISEMMSQDKDLRSVVKMLTRNVYPEA
jgi:chromosomal replication initiator protein